MYKNIYKKWSVFLCLHPTAPGCFLHLHIYSIFLLIHLYTHIVNYFLKRFRSLPCAALTIHPPTPYTLCIFMRNSYTNAACTRKKTIYSKCNDRMQNKKIKRLEKQTKVLERALRLRFCYLARLYNSK